jgi:hypothetical protein
MLKQGTPQRGRLVLPESEVVEEQRFAAAGRVVIGQQIARDLRLGDVRLG